MNAFLAGSSTEEAASGASQLPEPTSGEGLPPPLQEPEYVARPELGVDEGGMFAQWSDLPEGMDHHASAMLEDAMSLLPDLDRLSKNTLGGGMSAAGVAFLQEAGAGALLRGHGDFL